jgi:hypothetical protein
MLQLADGTTTKERKQYLSSFFRVLRIYEPSRCFRYSKALIEMWVFSKLDTWSINIFICSRISKTELCASAINAFMSLQ